MVRWIALLLCLLAPMAARAESPLHDLPQVPPGLPANVVTQARVDAALAELDRLVPEILASTGVPGASVAIVYQDRVVYTKGFGVRKVGERDRVDADTVFQLASVSKAVGATVMASLVGDGIVKWDDPVVKHDPSFALADPWVTQRVTLADLYSHRSGLPDHGGDDLEDLGYDRDYILAHLRLLPLAPFRDSWYYTNFGLTEAAIAAARSAGKSWEDLSDERLYTPLGMSRTTSRFAEFHAMPNRAVGHVLRDGRWQAKYVRQPDAQTPAGGVASSARDMARWLRLQLAEGEFDGRRVVDAAALVETHAPQAITHRPARSAERSGFYGLGWIVGTDDLGRVKLSHSGAFVLGAATSVTLIPQEEVGIVVLTNGEPIGVAEAISDSFVDLVTYGSIQRDWVTLRAAQMKAMLHPPPEHDYSKPPASPRPSRPTAQLVGRFANDYFGPMEIVPRNGGMALVLGPQRTVYPLRHWDGDVYLYDPSGENAEGPSAVSFLGDGSVVVEHLDANGLGTFRRR